VRGEGPPLLWISGYVVPARAFDAVTAELTDGYTVVAADHRGSGASNDPWLPTTTATMATDIVSVMDHLGIHAAHVAGFSLGGMVAQELAIRRPDRVLTLVLGSTSAGGPGVKAPAAGELLIQLRRTARRIPGKVDVGVLAAVRQGWAASTHDTTRRLDRIQAPTLVLHGGRDEAEWLARRISGAELRVVERAGHLLVIESPTARRALRTWLDTHADDPPSAPLGITARVGDLLSTPCRVAAAQSLPLRRLLRAGSRRAL